MKSPSCCVFWRALGGSKALKATQKPANSRKTGIP
jgi:hypothetical protein